MKIAKNFFLIILSAVLILVWVSPNLLTEFIKVYHIPSGAMVPTLLIGDNVTISKMAYNDSQPQLGDVAVFRSVVEPDTDFIKRVVGLPGDRIQMKEGILFINDVPCPLQPAGELEAVSDDQAVVKAPQYTETLPNGLKHLIWKKAPFGQGYYDNTPVYVVPAGHYFVMGDNRDGSNDSRAQEVIGYIPLENFVGRASFIYFSTGAHSKIWEYWDWISTAHYNRIFQGVH